MITRRAFVGSTLAVTLAPRSLFASSSRPSPLYFDAAGYGGMREPPVREGIPHRAVALLGAGGNSMLYRNDGESLLIDCKTAPFGGVLRADARRLGLAPGAATVLNTHHHADHTGGNHAFGGFEIVAHAKCEPRVRAQVEMYKSQAVGAIDQLKDDPKRELVIGPVGAFADKAAGLTADDFAPTRLFDAPKSDLVIGGKPVEVHHFGPGHTDNDLAVFFPDDNVLHTGDLLFNRVHPYVDRPGGATTLGWMESCEKLIGLCDAETVVVPGHGGVGGVEALRGQITYFERLRAAVGKELDAGKTRDDITAMSWDFMDGYGLDWIRPIAIGGVVDELSG